MIKLYNSKKHGHTKMIELKDHLKINLNCHLKIPYLKINQEIIF